MMADLIPAEKRPGAYSIMRMSNNTGVAIGPAIGGIIALANGLILHALSRLAKRLDDHESRISAMGDRLSQCRLDSRRDLTSKEDWIRSEGYTRRELKQVSETLLRLEGHITVVDKLPQICADIAGHVVERLMDRKEAAGG